MIPLLIFYWALLGETAIVVRARVQFETALQLAPVTKDRMLKKGRQESSDRL